MGGAGDAGFPWSGERSSGAWPQRIDYGDSAGFQAELARPGRKVSGWPVGTAGRRDLRLES